MNAVKVFLNKHHLTQAKLASYVGVDASTVSGWLNGKSVPEVEHIVKIGEFLAIYANMPVIVPIAKIAAVRCLLKANALNNFNTSDSNSKYHDNVDAYFELDGKGNVYIVLKRKI